MKQIAIDAEYRRVERDKRRVGRPRFFWLQLTMDRAHKSIRKRKGLAPPHNFDMNNSEHRNLIACTAMHREYPFHKKVKNKNKNKKKKTKIKIKIAQEKTIKTQALRQVRGTQALRQLRGTQATRQNIITQASRQIRGTKALSQIRGTQALSQTLQLAQHQETRTTTVQTARSQNVG